MELVKEIIKNQLRCGQYDDSGEYETRCNIDFMLNEPIKLDVMGKKYIIDRVKLYNSWGDNLYLSFSDGKKLYECLYVPTRLVHEVIEILNKEQKKGGKFQGFELTEDLDEWLYEMLANMDNKHCFGCTEELNENCSCMLRFKDDEEE